MSLRPKPKPKGPPRYIVDNGLQTVIDQCQPGPNTVEDLLRYLAYPEPNPDYRLVSCQMVGGNFVLVWELKEPPVVITQGGGCCGCSNQ